MKLALDTMPTVFIVGGGAPYERMFEDLGWALTKNIRLADLIQFTGGEDVSPYLYGHHKHPTTHTNLARDRRERQVFLFGKKAGIPMAGICRGGQFLNVMCGGTLFQDVDNHVGEHDVIDERTSEVFRASSTHHQMMIPGPEGVVICTASESCRRERMPTKTTIRRMTNDGPLGEDIEAVHYPEDMAFCFQPHPEFYRLTDLSNRYGAYLEELLYS